MLFKAGRQRFEPQDMVANQFVTLPKIPISVRENLLNWLCFQEIVHDVDVAKMTGS